MFGQADQFFETFKQIRDIRDQLSPKTLLDCDEMGSILPNDNDPQPPAINPLYWPASAGLFAYEFGNLAVLVSLFLPRFLPVLSMAVGLVRECVAGERAQGLDIMGISQFCGCPVLDQWGITDAQYPSVSMTDWATGEGNQR
jgi:hypothetical protein